MSYEYYGPGLGTNGDTEKNAAVVQKPLPMPGATPSGKPSEFGFSQYASEAAIREVATVDEELAPIQEAPEDSAVVQEAEERSSIERYQTHITLISTLVGLGTFGAWLLLRKKN